MFLSSYRLSSRRKVMAGTQGKNLETGNENESMKECTVCTVLTCVPWIIYLAFSCTQGPPVQVSHYPQCDDPSDVNH